MRAWLFLTALVVLGCAHTPRGAPVASSGARILTRRCQTCHAKPDPARYSADRWTEEIARMRLRLTLPEADWDSLLALGDDHTIQKGTPSSSRNARAREP